MADLIHRERTGLASSTRRALLRGIAAAAPAVLLLAPAARALASVETRVLRLQHLHTGERLSVVYFAQGQYVPESLAAIDQLLRDFHTDEVHTMDRALLDLLYDISRKLGRNTHFEVVSGYRSPTTNAMLRRTSGKVARHSLHMEGRAVDVHIDGLDTRLLRNVATAMRRGGVGYYPSSDFVHLDTGRFRTW